MFTQPFALSRYSSFGTKFSIYLADLPSFLSVFLFSNKYYIISCLSLGTFLLKHALKEMHGSLSKTVIINRIWDIAG